MPKLLIVGDPTGSTSLDAINNRGWSPEDITVWENDSRHVYAIKCISGIIDTILSKDTKKLIELGSTGMKFSTILANPPYQKGTKSSGNTLWDEFLSIGLELLEDGGYLSFITPSRWRQPEDKLSYVYKNYQLVSLHINGVDEGKKTFNASTPFDVYTIQKVAPYKKTHIIFSDGVEGDYDVTKFPFIPNSNIDFWLKAFSSDDEKLNAMWTYSHDPRQKHVYTEDEKPSTATYPLTHTFTKDGHTKRFSTKIHEYQNTPKVIFGDAGTPRPIYDPGVYGCTQHSIFIPVSDESEGKYVIDFLTNNNDIIESMTFSQRQFGPKPLNYIPKSFLFSTTN